jgi:diguanylate cyclase (GGDEF)-like protein/PAS domain S-box-containing protein
LRKVVLEHPFQEAAMPHELHHNDGVGCQGEQLSELKAAALEAAANAIAITDREGIIVWVNPAFHQLTGYSREEAIGQSIRLLKSGQHPATFYKSLWDAILAGEKWQGHIVNRRKDGSLYDEAMTIAPVQNGNGKITHFIAVKQDTTDQNRAQERASMLIQAVQNSPDLIGVSNRAGEFAFVNEALLKMTGRQPEEVIGKHFGTIFSPSNPGAVVEGIGTQGLESGGWKGDCILRRRDETDFPVFLNVGPIKDNEGRITGMFGIARDITERKRVEESLRSSEEKFRELAEHIRVVFFVTTPEPFAITYISPAYDQIFGRQRQQVYDQPTAWIESIYPEDRERVFSVLAESQQGVETKVEYRIMRPDGSVRWISTLTFPVHDSNGKLVRMVGILEDITERKEKAEALRDAHEELNVALKELKKQSQDAAKLSELVDILQSCQNAEEAYKITENVLQSMVRSTAGALCITSPSRDVVEVVGTWGSIAATEKIFRPDDCWALRRGKIHRVKDPMSPLRCAHVSKSLANGYVCVPLAAQGETLGVLYVESVSVPAGSAVKTGHDETEDLERQAIAVGERISLALANLRLREVLRGQSIRDPLTGLFNRRFMEESLERELRRAVRGKQQVALLMLDVDQFKRFNDTFGHQAGDALLRALGNLLKESTRGQDVVCRYGGEEFAFVLAGASLDAARTRAELLREDVKQLNAQHGGQLLGAVTLSIGIAVFPENGDSAEQLLKAADDALYRAKESGRDRIVCA